MNRWRKALAPLLLAVLLSGCTDVKEIAKDSLVYPASDAESVWDAESAPEIEDAVSGAGDVADVRHVPAYAGDPYVILNENEPGPDMPAGTEGFEEYAELDSLGRCGTAVAVLGMETMPASGEERGSISNVKPSGWNNKDYGSLVDGGYLYNRCHLIGWQLSAENDNERNLVTGTRYLNVDGMLPFENLVAGYIRDTGNHVAYRVSPFYQKDNLVAYGIEMEARSIEDNGDGILFHVFCYNVQPGVLIDYTDGSNSLEPLCGTKEGDEDSAYILNTSSKKFHTYACPMAGKISDGNREEYAGSREDLVADGYSPCGTCNP